MRHLPTQSRARQRVQRILACAEDMLNEGDVSALTTNALAERAGVPVGSIYQYFADRDQIVVALLEVFRDEIIAVYQSQESASIVEQLVTPILNHGELHFGIARVLMMPPAVTALVHAAEQVRDDLLGEWLRIITLHLPDMTTSEAKLAAEVSLTATIALTARGALAKQAALDSHMAFSDAHEAASRIIKQAYPLLNGYFAQISAQHQSSPE